MGIKDITSHGKRLPIMEEFYSLQGEGINTGKPAYFIRIGGCDVCCHWCDVKESWDPSIHKLIHVEEVIKRVVLQKANSVVVTGGEPLNYNLDFLCSNLKRNNIECYIETSGYSPLSGIWDWICLSPKKNFPPLEEICNKAHELKVVIETEDDFIWAEENSKLVSANCQLLLQPEWSRREVMKDKIIDYILKNPKWRISLQTHKYLKIP